jgi:hypothetical protein
MAGGWVSADVFRSLSRDALSSIEAWLKIQTHTCRLGQSLIRAISYRR